MMGRTKARARFSALALVASGAAPATAQEGPTEGDFTRDVLERCGAEYQLCVQHSQTCHDYVWMNYRGVFATTRDSLEGLRARIRQTEGDRSPISAEARPIVRCLNENRLTELERPHIRDLFEGVPSIHDLFPGQSQDAASEPDPEASAEDGAPATGEGESASGGYAEPGPTDAPPDAGTGSGEDTAIYTDDMPSSSESESTLDSSSESEQTTTGAPLPVSPAPPADDGEWAGGGSDSGAERIPEDGESREIVEDGEAASDGSYCYYAEDGIRYCVHR